MQILSVRRFSEQMLERVARSPLRTPGKAERSGRLEVLARRQSLPELSQFTIVNANTVWGMVSHPRSFLSELSGGEVVVVCQTAVQSPLATNG